MSNATARETPACRRVVVTQDGASLASLNWLGSR